MSRRLVLSSYVALWSATAAGAALGLAGLHLMAADAPSDALDASPQTALELLAHNAPVALWPLALTALGWPTLPGLRLVGDALIATHLLAHGLSVGSSLAARPELWRYLPHLPFEWLALAIPAGSWLAARNDQTVRDSRAAVATSTAVCVVVLAGAAAIETYAVPVS